MSRRDAERNRRNLLEAATDALAQNPGASMAQVAQAAGLARATLYRHFSTRQELIEALRVEALARATAAITDAHLDEGSPLDGLRRAVDALASLGLRFRALLLAGSDGDTAFLHQRAEVLAPLRGVVQRGQQEGLLRSDLSAEWVVMALASLLVAGVRASTDVADSGVASRVLDTLIEGVGARP